MLTEVREGEPRAEAYWAEQLAFGPVLVHALRLRLRTTILAAEHQQRLGQTVRLAKSALAALPEQPGLDPALLHILARRQARALSWGRRRCLTRLLVALEAADPESSAVPSRMTRPYALLGWHPDERLSG
jgi:hypothetical protein